MKLSFEKTLQGHEIKFVRLIPPGRYEVLLKNLHAAPLKITLEKDDTGAWNIDEPDKLPGWVNEITLEIQEAVEENEG